jgi:uncharacterized protein
VRLLAHRRGLLVVAPLGLLLGLAVGLGGYLLLRPRGAEAVDPGPPCVPARPCLALVIDDVGRDPAALQALLALPFDLTFAVLPHAAHTAESRRAVLAAGRELLLHLPMVPLDRSRITDEPIVVGRDGPAGEATRRCLAAVPEAVGVNNHMGSAITQDAAAMQDVVAALGSRRLLLDSRTSERSVFCQVARGHGLPCLERDVFLDDPQGPAALTSAWVRAVAVAQQRGWAIAVAHPFGATIAALRDLLKRRAIRVVRLSRLLARPMPT